MQDRVSHPHPGRGLHTFRLVMGVNWPVVLLLGRAYHTGHEFLHWPGDSILSMGLRDLNLSKFANNSTDTKKVRKLNSPLPKKP